MDFTVGNFSTVSTVSTVSLSGTSLMRWGRSWNGAYADTGEVRYDRTLQASGLPERVQYQCWIVAVQRGYPSQAYERPQGVSCQWSLRAPRPSHNHLACEHNQHSA